MNQNIEWNIIVFVCSVIGTVATANQFALSSENMDAAELFCEEIIQWGSDNDVEKVDALLLAASDEYERSTTATPTSPAPATRHHMRFAPPQTEQQIQRARIDGIPESTKKDTKYCLKIWEEWSKRRHTGVSLRSPL